MKNLRPSRLDLFFVFLLLSLSIFTWRQIPELVIRGDGFVYMVSPTLKEFFSRPYWYTGFETSAAVLGTILPKLYKTNISLYFYTSLTVMMLINVLFYILLRVITKHKMLSFLGALLFAVNYFGNWGMYSQHCYCFFMERIVSVPFLLVSFIFLHLSLEKKNWRFLTISLLVYFFAIGIAHFAVLFTAPFFFYPFFWSFFQKKRNRKSLIRGLLISLSFLFISGFFVLIQKISYAQIGPTHGMMEYFLNPAQNRYPERIIRQLVHWSQYQPIIKHFGEYSFYGQLDVKSAQESTNAIIALYSVVALFIFKQLPKMRALLLTTILGTLMIFSLNSWFGQYDVLSQPGANRYLYFPTFLLVLFWTLFLWMLWQSKHRYLKILALLFVCAYFLLNYLLIWDSYRDVLVWDRSTKAIYKYMTSMREKLSKNTLVVAPYPEVGVYESRFFTEQIGKNEVRFVPVKDPYVDWKNIATISAHVIMLRYESECDCVKEKQIK